ncbi:class I SAM-dependent methyltransferase [Streptomyces boncukensis]|uniref:Class I SAM-dependent methyltransferase n=1 Tax=Streptomyces boncukensis TaxID=2711219 RepID=A0A6G4X7Q2_9ACTN|nr:class I SAM-dependent methyltransferase [Streptomyces boncukensis]NGO72880.1 class I SAM-dependent methyltransferase [Streptomyces boncukensis]
MLQDTAEDIGIYDVGDVYDAIYHGRGKDYRHETEVVVRHIRARKPEAAAVLDVGCGTGGHLRFLAEEFPHAEGIDLAEGMREVARRELPGVPVHAGDMRDFAMGRRYDAIVCLFCAVGNLSGTGELDRTLAAMARHLTPGGVIVLEPWWFPENFTPGHVGGSVITSGARTVARVSHTVRTGDFSSMEVHYVVAEPGTGVRHFSDVHPMALYTREQYEAAFRRAGCTVEHITGEYDGNGLFVGVQRWLP